MDKGGTENEEEGTGKGQDDVTVRDKYRTEIPRKQGGMCTGRRKVYYEGPKLKREREEREVGMRWVSSRGDKTVAL